MDQQQNRPTSDQTPGPLAHSAGPDGATVVPFAVDVYEGEETIVLRADLPGVGPDDLTVEIDASELVITGAQSRAVGVPRRYGRRFRVGSGVDREKVEAALDAGVLTITLHKTAAHKPRRIEVKRVA